MAEKVSVIIPAHDEADLIGDTVRAAKGIAGVTEVIVIDDASVDGTSGVAREAGADRVIVLKENKGKGGALNEAWPSAEGDILLLLDGDLGASASEGEKLLRPVLSGEAGMTIAIFGGIESVSSAPSNQGAKSGGFGLVVKAARFGIKRLAGEKIIAPLSGQRAVRREVIEKVGGFAPKFGVEVALTIDALRIGCKIVEIPVAMVHRPSGRNLRGFLHRGRQFIDVTRALSAKVR